MQERLHLVDAIRGFSIMSMVAFHLCYDLVYIVRVPLAWFAPPWQDIWRASISWTFLFVAGAMCALSRDNLRRAAKYGVVAVLVFVATTVVAVDDPISFGIIFCMATSTLVEYGLERAGVRPYGSACAAALSVLFLVTFDVPRGALGIGGLNTPLPRSLYARAGLAWLGLPGPGFVSGDYYPLIPHTLLFLAGAALGWWLKDRGFPKAAYELRCAPLEAAGRHTLPVYVLHQPLILAALAVVGLV